jgi:hypothetical protein
VGRTACTVLVGLPTGQERSRPGAGQLDLERTVIHVDEVYICELCLRAFEPEEEELAEGVRKLKMFEGYTVDLRLQQFRKMELGKLPQFIDFESPKGKKLLAQMHEEVTR